MAVVQIQETPTTRGALATGSQAQRGAFKGKKKADKHVLWVVRQLPDALFDDPEGYIHYEYISVDTACGLLKRDNYKKYALGMIVRDLVAKLCGVELDVVRNIPEIRPGDVVMWIRYNGESNLSRPISCNAVIYVLRTYASAEEVWEEFKSGGNSIYEWEEE